MTTSKDADQQVRRNLERFPADFMFRLSTEEHGALMLQIATSKPSRGGRRKPPLVFTEHGAIMAATLLSSSRAVEMSIYVVRAFVQFREMLVSNKELAQKLTQLERLVDSHDSMIVGILKTIRELTNVPETRAIGFIPLEEKNGSTLPFHTNVMSKKIKHSNEPVKAKIIRDFLPPPDELALAEEGVKVTVSLSRRSLDFFREAAERHHTSCQRMIRRLLDTYADQYRADLTKRCSRRSTGSRR